MKIIFFQFNQIMITAVTITFQFRKTNRIREKIIK